MALRTTKNRVPESVTGIAKMMEMEPAEIRVWPYLDEVRTAIKDYNIGFISKQRLISRLNDIAIKNNNSAEKLQHYATAITENLLVSIRLSY